MGRLTLNRRVKGLLAFVAVAGVAAFFARDEIGMLVHVSIDFFRAAGPGPFFCAMALLPVVGVPLSPFTVVAGPVFGPTLGVPTVIAYTLLAVAVNVALSYVIADRVLRSPAERFAQWLGYPIPVVPPGAAWEIALLARIIPGTPFFLQSYLLALARVPFGIYMVASIGVPSAYLVSAILVGDALMRGDWRGLIAAAVLTVAALIVMRRLKQRFSKPVVKVGEDS